MKEEEWIISLTKNPFHAGECGEIEGGESNEEVKMGWGKLLQAAEAVGEACGFWSLTNLDLYCLYYSLAVRLCIFHL